MLRPPSSVLHQGWVDQFIRRLIIVSQRDKKLSNYTLSTLNHTMSRESCQAWTKRKQQCYSSRGEKAEKCKIPQLEEKR